MNAAHIQNVLNAAERCSDEVAAALVSGESAALEPAASALRQSAIELSALLQRLTRQELDAAALQPRLKNLADRMAMQRENLIRRTVLVERALAVIVPATGAPTGYGQASRSYGGVGKQTGAFKYLAA